MTDYGQCGDKAPGLLPLLVGDPVDRCPTAIGLEDSEIVRLGHMLPSAFSLGELKDAPAHELPPFYRDALLLAQSWVNVRQATLNKIAAGGK